MSANVVNNWLVGYINGEGWHNNHHAEPRCAASTSRIRIASWLGFGASHAWWSEGGQRLTPQQVERRRRTAKKLNLGRFLHKDYYGPWWTKAEVRLLGKLPEEEVARRTGRTVEAVRQKREVLARDKRERGGLLG